MSFRFFHHPNNLKRSPYSQFTKEESKAFERPINSRKVLPLEPRFIGVQSPVSKPWLHLPITRQLGRRACPGFGNSTHKGMEAGGADVDTSWIVRGVCLRGRRDPWLDLMQLNPTAHAPLPVSRSTDLLS